MVCCFGCCLVQTPGISFEELKDRQVAFTHTRLSYIGCQGQPILPHPLQLRTPLLSPYGFLNFAAPSHCVLCTCLQLSVQGH